MKALMLIFAFVAGTSEGGAGVHSLTVPFQTLERCEKAAEKVMAQPNYFAVQGWRTHSGATSIRAVCVEQ